MTDLPSGPRYDLRARAIALGGLLAAEFERTTSADQVLLAWARFKPQLDVVRRAYMEAMAARIEGALIDYFEFEANIIALVLGELDEKGAVAEKKLILERLRENYGEMLAELETAGPATKPLIKKLFPDGARKVPPTLIPAAPSSAPAPPPGSTVAPNSSLSSAAAAAAPGPTVAPNSPLSSLSVSADEPSDDDNELDQTPDSTLPPGQQLPDVLEVTMEPPNERKRGGVGLPPGSAAKVTPPNQPAASGAKKKVTSKKTTQSQRQNNEIRGELSFDDSD